MGPWENIKCANIHMIEVPVGEKKRNKNRKYLKI